MKTEPPHKGVTLVQSRWIPPAFYEAPHGHDKRIDPSAGAPNDSLPEFSVRLPIVAYFSVISCWKQKDRLIVLLP